MTLGVIDGRRQGVERALRGFRHDVVGVRGGIDQVGQCARGRVTRDAPMKRREDRDLIVAAESGQRIDPVARRQGFGIGGRHGRESSRVAAA